MFAFFRCYFQMHLHRGYCIQCPPGDKATMKKTAQKMHHRVCFLRWCMVLQRPTVNKYIPELHHAVCVCNVDSQCTTLTSPGSDRCTTTSSCRSLAPRCRQRGDYTTLSYVMALTQRHGARASHRTSANGRSCLWGSRHGDTRGDSSVASHSPPWPVGRTRYRARMLKTWHTCLVEKLTLCFELPRVPQHIHFPLAFGVDIAVWTAAAKETSK